MKYIKTFESYTVNEEFFGKISSYFSKGTSKDPSKIFGKEICDSMSEFITGNKFWSELDDKVYELLVKLRNYWSLNNDLESVLNRVERYIINRVVDRYAVNHYEPLIITFNDILDVILTKHNGQSFIEIISKVFQVPDAVDMKRYSETWQDDILANFNAKDWCKSPKLGEWLSQYPGYDRGTLIEEVLAALFICAVLKNTEEYVSRGEWLARKRSSGSQDIGHFDDL